MDKSTDLLLSELNHIQSLTDFQKNNEEELIVPDALEKLLQAAAANNLTKADLVKRSGIDRTYAYHLLSGEKKLTRDKLILLALAASLSLAQIQPLLKYAGVRELYARDKRDATLIFAFNKKLAVYEVEELLEDFKLKPLSKF
jgi:transcriptional regulator with XRE-family HTH domain